MPRKTGDLLLPDLFQPLPPLMRTRGRFCFPAGAIQPPPTQESSPSLSHSRRPPRQCTGGRGGPRTHVTEIRYVTESRGPSGIERSLIRIPIQSNPFEYRSGLRPESRTPVRFPTHAYPYPIYTRWAPSNSREWIQYTLRDTEKLERLDRTFGIKRSSCKLGLESPTSEPTAEYSFNLTRRRWLVDDMFASL